MGSVPTEGCGLPLEYEGDIKEILKYEDVKLCQNNKLNSIYLVSMDT